MTSKRKSKSQNLCEDIISTFPSSIIDTILCRVPLKDAVRTSILSRNWKYKWTKIPKLVFIKDDMFDRSTDGQRVSHPRRSFGIKDNDRLKLKNNCKVFYAIYQVLLLHQGPIHEFTLSMRADATSVEIDQIILYLSRHNTLKKLSMNFGYYDFYDKYSLPLSFFSLHQLTDLYLQCCILTLEPTFIGFVNLTSLHLHCVKISSKTLLLIVSGCPLLKRFILDLYDEDDIKENGDVTIIDILKCLPLIEHMSITRHPIEFFDEVGVPQDIPIALVHLKYLTIIDMKFTEVGHLSFLHLMIRSSTNLNKIKLQIYDTSVLELDDDEVRKNSATLGDYSDIWFEHLIELEIDGLFLELELEFVKLILAKSPVLKKVHLMVDVRVTNHEELKMLRNLIRSPRASTVAEIAVERQKY